MTNKGDSSGLELWAKGYTEGKQEIKTDVMRKGIEGSYIKALDIVEKYGKLKANSEIDSLESGRYMAWLIFEKNFKSVLRDMDRGGTANGAVKQILSVMGIGDVKF